MHRHGFHSPPGPVPGYYEYHGADQVSPIQPPYFGVHPLPTQPFRPQDGGLIVLRKSKKSFAEKLSNKLDKLAKPKEKDKLYNKAYQEVYRDHFGNILIPSNVRTRHNSSVDAWPHYTPSPLPKRTFHNVIHRGRSAPGNSSNTGGHVAANRTWSGWPEGGGSGFAGVQQVAHSTLSNDPSIYGEALYEDYKNFAINSNMCMCEDYFAGTQRGKKGKKRCKKCGFDRLGTNSHIRRSISEESVNGQYADPYEYVRKRRLVNPRPVFYDEQDEYEDIEFSSQPRVSNDKVNLDIKSSRSRSPQRNSISPNRKNNRTQSMIVNNRNRLNTKENKEMQNIAIRSSPMRSVSSVGTTKPSEPNHNVVTVNGCETKNSSIIYLSPDTTPLRESSQRVTEKNNTGANSVTVSMAPSLQHSETNDSTLIDNPSNMQLPGTVRVNPYDLIKKYIADSPNSLSDSNHSSDDPPDEKHFSQKYDDSDFDSDSDEIGNRRMNHFTSTGSFKISGQKIQIYSDGSLSATNNVNHRVYSLSDSEVESDKESEYSNYDADCSVVESPRFMAKTLESTPIKPPRCKSSEREITTMTENIQHLTIVDLEQSNPLRLSPKHDNVKTFPRASSKTKERVSPKSSEKTAIYRKSSSDSQKSIASRSKSFTSSKESLNLFGSTDFKNLGISKNFSSEIIQEIYGSKTSLLKHLDQQREERKLRKSEVVYSDQKELDAKLPAQLNTEEFCKSVEKPIYSSPQCLCKNTGKEEVNNLSDRKKILQISKSADKLSSAKHGFRGQPYMFNDTTRLRLMSRPSLKDALQSFSSSSSGNGRVGKSQSFRERIISPLRPKDPPPLPPHSEPIFDGENLPAYSLAKKFFSFNKSEIRRINKFLGIQSPVEKQQENNMYDIAENDETQSNLGVTVINNSTFYTGDRVHASLPKDSETSTSPKTQPKSSDLSPTRDPIKPPRAKKERSKSFTPRSNPLNKTSIFNRSLSHIPKSTSSSSLTGKHVFRSYSGSRKSVSSSSSENCQTKRTLSSSDLIHIFPDEERRSFKDIRKILSSPSISSSSSSSTNQIYRPKSQLSNSSSVINSIKEEQVDLKPEKDSFADHIYETIQDTDMINQSQPNRRPLPPIPAEKLSSSSRTSPILIEQASPVKSIFEGASKYDILNYLEDAKERGLTDCDLDLDEEEDNDIVTEEQQVATIIIRSRNQSNRISKLSTDSSGSEGENLVSAGKDKLSNVEIERNDSGLGSETSRGRASNKVVVRKRTDDEIEELVCLDCDHVLEPTQDSTEMQDLIETPLCENCATRRAERKEIITEIIETEIKYGRDLLIIYEEFYRPMLVAGLLSPEQLANVFLNVEELIQVNAKFTEGLKDAIEIALDQGDEDLCTVSIGKLFMEASPMLGAFKSYCTRQGTASSLLASLEREKELLRIFLKVSQMENTILRRMNLSSFLMVPVQRVTRYPLLLSRLYKVTPVHHGDRDALQESRELIEQGLDTMNQETNRDSGTTKLWRRISMINPPYRRSENPIDFLGSTTWGVRKMVLESLGWGKEAREDVSFVLESRLLYTQPTDANWKTLFSVKLSPINALLVTLGQNLVPPTFSTNRDDSQYFPTETGCKEAALILLKEKGMRYSPIREPLLLDKCVICWEQDWEDYFEVTEFSTKESYIFKGEDPQQTLNWFHCIKFYCNGLGGWRRRRNGLANIMINGMARSEEIGRENFNLIS